MELGAYPRDYMAGEATRLPHEWAADVAGMTTLGSGAMPGAANELRSGIKAYHGSPYDFDRFDMSKIGTGEGAQAYGHGLYFAENPGVAKSYQSSLATPQAKYPTGEVITGGPSSVENDAIMLLQASGHDYDRAIESARKSVQSGRQLTNNPEYAAQSAGVLRLLEDMKARGAKFEPGGKTYEVSINANPDEFLDWDAPLSQQSQKVKEALVAAGHKINDKTVGSLDNLAIKNPSSVRALQSAGIKGIRYKDAGSRDPQKMKELADDLAQYREAAKQWAATGNEEKLRIANKQIEVLTQRLQQTHNYVVFDDQIIDILKKYGIAGLIAAGLGPEVARQVGQARGQPEGTEVY